MRHCKKFIVNGLVQGVFFRVSTLRQAELLELKGYVKNKENGDVVVIACGEESHLNRLQEWLWLGPENARVSEVTVEQVSAENFSNFSIC